MLVKANRKATFPYGLQRVWEVVTSLTNYSWRSDIEKLEVVSDTQFIETTKDGYRTVFTITKQEPCRLWEFDMENENIKGHWVGVFSGNDHDAVFHGVFQRCIEQYLHLLATDEPHFYDTFSEASVSRNLHDDAGFACLQF